MRFVFNMADEPEDKTILQDVLAAEGEKNKNVLLSYVNFLGGVASKVKDIADVDVWPDVNRVNRLVEVWTVVGYSVGVFTVAGSFFFAVKASRELSQWRTWWKFRRNTLLKKEDK